MEKIKYEALLHWLKYHFAEDGNGYISLDTQEYYTINQVVAKYINSHKQD